MTSTVKRVLEGHLAAGFCAVRPPGHHALAERAMGFCVFNNVAIGARFAKRHNRLKRILIVDWDVHHGNGTQDIFYDDPSVVYFSTHQFPSYPGTGRAEERGSGKGVSATVNVPFPSGSGDDEIIEAFQEVLIPKASAFKPELILISAGFDAHSEDPLGDFKVTDSGYAKMTRIVRQIAEEHCQGRLVSVLEGGYHLQALGRSIEAHLREMMGK